MTWPYWLTSGPAAVAEVDGGVGLEVFDVVLYAFGGDDALRYRGVGAGYAAFRVAHGNYCRAAFNDVGVCQGQGGVGSAVRQLHYRQIGQYAPAEYASGVLEQLSFQVLHLDGYGFGVVNDVAVGDHQPGGPYDKAGSGSDAWDFNLAQRRFD